MTHLLLLIFSLCSNTCNQSYTNTCDTTTCIVGTDCYDCGIISDNDILLQFSNSTNINGLNTSLGVVNGISADDGMFPFLVSLQTANSHQCTGFFVHEKFIVTAAHCFTNVESFEVVVNDTSVSSSNRVNSKRIISHPQFSYLDHSNDIGIVELDTVFPNIPTLKIVPPSTRKQTYTISGWGALEFGNLASDTLQYTTATLTNIQNCIENYIFVGESRVYKDTDVCTLPSSSGPCQGDSGAPLFDPNRLETIAIVRMQHKCANAYNTIYTRLDIHKSFICTHVPVSYLCNTNDLPPSVQNLSPPSPLSLNYTHQLILIFTIQSPFVNTNDFFPKLSSFLYIDQSLMTIRSHHLSSNVNNTIEVHLLANGIIESQTIRHKIVNVSLSSLSSTLGVIILDIEISIHIIESVPSSPPIQPPPLVSDLSLIISLPTALSGILFCILGSVLYMKS